MITALLVILIILWLLGYINIQGLNLPDTTLFAINSQPITLWDILILLVLSAIVGILPRPFREIAGVLLILWVLAVLGILSFFGGLASLLVLAIIIGLIVFLLGGF